MNAPTREITRTKLWKIALYLVLTIAAVGVAVILLGLFGTLRPLDALGEASDNCAREDFSPVPNGYGLVATAHFTSCGYFIVHGDATTYVYVNPEGTKEGRKSLVFRFSNFDHFDPPQIMWSNESTLHISVPAVGEVTRQIATIDGVKILYSIGKEDVPAGESDRDRRRIALVLFVLLVFLTAICVITAKSIRKANKVSGRASLPQPNAGGTA
ncbi:MAG TPA: hypothetical protein VMD77_09905 [Candidatus Baltobacteraceae bacterium]|nr:hypothetical protein [Candidatus Baltobacteraceae bacterium]